MLRGRNYLFSAPAPPLSIISDLATATAPQHCFNVVPALLWIRIRRIRIISVDPDSYQMIRIWIQQEALKTENNFTFFALLKRLLIENLKLSNIHTKNIDYERVHIFKIFLVLNPFFSWIRIRIMFAWIRIRIKVRPGSGYVKFFFSEPGSGPVST